MGVPCRLFALHEAQEGESVCILGEGVVDRGYHAGLCLLHAVQAGLTVCMERGLGLGDVPA